MQLHSHESSAKIDRAHGRDDGYMDTICGSGYLVGGVELVVHEPGDDAGLAHGLVAEEHQLVFGQRRHHRRRHRAPTPRCAA